MDPRFESIQVDINSSFRCWHFTCRSFAEDHTWHYHPEFELTWIIRSAGTRFVGDNIQQYESGDLVLIGPNLPHCWHNESRMDLEEQPDLIVVQFSESWPSADFLCLEEAAPIRRMLEAASCGIHFRNDLTIQRVGDLMRAIAHATGMERVVKLIQILDMLAGCRAYSLLASPNYKLSNEINQMNRQRVELVHKYVRDNLGEDIKQAEVAMMVGLKPPAFSRFFRAATGQTFVGFTNLLRVNKACRLLSNYELSITTIAMDCGYRNISNFNRQFLAVKGINPTNYRDLLRRRDDHLTEWPRLRTAL